MPTTPAEIRGVQRGFYDIARFPRVVSCLDGTHIEISPPEEREQDFVNRKGYHSLNVQVQYCFSYKHFSKN